MKSESAYRAGRRRRRSIVLPRAAAALACVCMLPATLAAQPATVRNEVFVNAEIERYLRVLQVSGLAGAYPWSLRAFSPAEVERLLPAAATHPWAARYDLTAPPARGALSVGAVAPRVDVIYNSTFAYGANDGPVWAGRGITTAVRAGASVRAGPLSLVLAPVAFRAENRGFALTPNAETGALAYADHIAPRRIDRPQRFGDAAFARIDAGQSTLRLDLPFVAVGVSTANQHWGPADEQPLLLGSNAPGFLHAFAGTAAPIDIGIGRVHGRLLWGRLEQSEFTPLTGAAADRFGTGMVALFQPRGLDGLELGFGRFYHMRWSDRDFTRIIDTLWKSSLADTDNPSGASPDNQLASVFFRWLMPRAGLEVWGEFGREDHNWNLRDALMQPDHASAWGAGFRRAWQPAPGRITAVRGEVINAEPSHLLEHRHQTRWYVHSGTRQGHTHRGRVLGAPAGLGGRGAALAADAYSPAGRWTVAWSREQRSPAALFNGTGANPGADVQHALRIETVRFAGRFDIAAGATGVYNLNRDFTRDAFNFRLATSVRAAF